MTMAAVSDRLCCGGISTAWVGRRRAVACTQEGLAWCSRAVGTSEQDFILSAYCAAQGPGRRSGSRSVRAGGGRDVWAGRLVGQAAVWPDQHGACPARQLQLLTLQQSMMAVTTQCWPGRSGDDAHDRARASGRGHPGQGQGPGRGGGPAAGKEGSLRVSTSRPSASLARTNSALLNLGLRVATAITIIKPSPNSRRDRIAVGIRTVLPISIPTAPT